MVGRKKKTPASNEWCRSMRTIETNFSNDSEIECKASRTNVDVQVRVHVQMARIKTPSILEPKQLTKS